MVDKYWSDYCSLVPQSTSYLANDWRVGKHSDQITLPRGLLMTQVNILMLEGKSIYFWEYLNILSAWFQTSPLEFQTWEEQRISPGSSLRHFSGTTSTMRGLPHRVSKFDTQWFIENSHSSSLTESIQLPNMSKLLQVLIRRKL